MALPELTLSPLNDAVCRVLDGQGRHVGNLKLINGQWKFKAIGYTPKGDVIPGGGPLTDRHNTTFAILDEAVIAATLCPPGDSCPIEAWNKPTPPNNA